MNNIQKINYIAPLEILSNNCIFYKTKCVIFKYIYTTINHNTFLYSIKFINNYYYNLLKVNKSKKKNSVKNKENLMYSTRKIRKQKGLGKARAGSAKSSLRKGGIKLFGPKNNKLFIILRKKNKKLNFLFIFLNKRTHISFIVFSPVYHYFYSLFSFFNQYKRSKGFLFSKVVYNIYTRFEFKKKSIYSINLIDDITLSKYIECNFILLFI